jgi:hypothetical protein
MTTSSRVLVLGDYPIGYANGIGETLSDLLDDWPDAALFQMHPAHLVPLPGRQRGRATTFEVPRQPAGLSPWRVILNKPLLKARQAVAQRRLLAAAAALIRRERIQAVLTYPVTPWVLFAAVQLRRAFPDLRFAFYVMDDWEGHHTCFGLPFTPKRRAALATMVRLADTRFACSHLMKADYERRFGNAWQVLHKGMPLPAPAAPPAARRFSTILYTGGMNVFRFDAVVAFAEGLRRFRTQTGRDVTLTLLGPAPDREYAARLAHFDFIHAEPWVDNDACQKRLADADLLYLPLSFADKLERIANLAMPTKLSEYLASGRPSIFHTPARSEVQALAVKAGLPLTLNSVDPDDIHEFLTHLDSEGIDEAAYQRQVRWLLETEFNPKVLRSRLALSLEPRPARPRGTA